MSDRQAHELVEMAVADDATAWSAAGFTVDDDTVTIGPTSIRLVGSTPPRGIRSVTALGVGAPIDGIPFAPPGPSRAVPVGAPHRNVVIAIDHLVVVSPNMDRTSAALEADGLVARRTRRFDAGGRSRRQMFFWLGATILELAGDDAAHGGGPATLWGLAFTCVDLTTAATALGDALGRVKPAVQTGRRIAILRTGDLDISVPIALMSPHPSGPATG